MIGICFFKGFNGLFITNIISLSFRTTHSSSILNADSSNENGSSSMPFSSKRKLDESVDYSAQAVGKEFRQDTRDLSNEGESMVYG